MLKVGLTGSIAVGKSFVLARLRTLGCLTSDADHIAREVVAQGSEGLNAVVAEFGDGVLDAHGALDRARLRTIVFESEEHRLRLNEILHPLILERQDRMLAKWEVEAPSGIGVVEAALMIESGGFRRFDKIIVVHCDTEKQIERLIRRNSVTRDEAERRIGAQMPQSEKIRYADFLIDTSDDKAATMRRTNEVYREMRKLLDDSANIKAAG